MKLTTLMLAAILSLLTGCHSLPAVNAKKVTYDSSYPIGGTNIEADNIQITDTLVSVEKYKRTSKWGWFSQTVTVEGYSRPRDTHSTIPAP